MLESKRQARIVEWLEEEAGCIVIKQTTNRGYGRTAWPDLLVLPPMRGPERMELHYPARSGAHLIETKTPKGKLSTMQRHRISQLRVQGYPVLIAQTVEEVQSVWLYHFDTHLRNAWWGTESAAHCACGLPYRFQEELDNQLCCVCVSKGAE